MSTKNNDKHGSKRAQERTERRLAKARKADSQVEASREEERRNQGALILRGWGERQGLRG